MNRSLKIGLGGLALCGACSLIFLNANKDDIKEAGRAKATKEALETAAPPTTEAPDVEATATGASNPAAAEYATWMRGKIAELQAPTATVQEAFKEMGSNPTIILTDAWKTKVGVALGYMQAVTAEMRSHPAPAGATNAKVLAMTVSDYIDEGGTLTAQAIDAIDADKLKAGMAKFAVAGQMMGDLNAELAKLDIAAP